MGDVRISRLHRTVREVDGSYRRSVDRDERWTWPADGWSVRRVSRLSVCLWPCQAELLVPCRAVESIDSAKTPPSTGGVRSSHESVRGARSATPVQPCPALALHPLSALSTSGPVSTEMGDRFRV